jgi:hypothetical protein
VRVDTRQLDRIKYSNSTCYISLLNSLNLLKQSQKTLYRKWRESLYCVPRHRVISSILWRCAVWRNRPVLRPLLWGVIRLKLKHSYCSTLYFCPPSYACHSFKQTGFSLLGDSFSLCDIRTSRTFFWLFAIILSRPRKWWRIWLSLNIFNTESYFSVCLWGK